MSPPVYRSWAEVDCAALRHNVRTLRQRLPAGTAIMAVVKANAYGHGIALVAPVLAPEVEYLGIANLAEALELRGIVAEKPILILGTALPEEREPILAHGFIPALSDWPEAQAYSEAAMRLGIVASVHIAIDTGMGRIGVWQDDAPALVHAVRGLPGLRVDGLGSHLPVADEDTTYTRDQLARFHRLVGRLRAEGVPAGVAHIENSAGALVFPASAGDFVRAGLMLYGSSPLPEMQGLLRQVITWKTRVTLIREVPEGRTVSYGRTFVTTRAMRIATLGVGYADGYRRHLNGRAASVLVRGQRCPLLGRVTMDQIMIDVSAWSDVAVGEEVVLLGRQGEAEILAAELAEKSGTIAWDIFTGIGQRVGRIAVDSAA